MVSLDSILVPTDFSDTSKLALTYAQGLAEKFDASLHLLHVVSDENLGPGAAELWGFSPDDLLDKWKVQAEAELEAFCPADERSKLGIDAVLRTGRPFVEIVKHASEQSVDLIVIGTHGRGAVAHLLLGSVAEHVVRTAPCPVLTIRSPDHTFTMS